ncbi:hypothetical protein DCCM_4847 [Desulfocucumis palustris]|uniref:Uncharacterized protein n=1 Tax=Desulfocucumis palustris TaxID=1898651 RepID=A0A2L2XHK3_9FIRM|nr:hypothetical protein DCCM_4847 [Desulfocucumis palustris]
MKEFCLEYRKYIFVILGSINRGIMEITFIDVKILYWPYLI